MDRKPYNQSTFFFLKKNTQQQTRRLHLSITMLTPTKNLSTETMSKLAQAKDNKYTLLYLPFHGVVTALRAMFVMSDAEYTFIHPAVSNILTIHNLRNQAPHLLSNVNALTPC